MRHPKSLNRAVTHLSGDALRRGSYPARTTPRSATAPPPGVRPGLPVAGRTWSHSILGPALLAGLAGFGGGIGVFAVRTAVVGVALVGAGALLVALRARPRRNPPSSSGGHERRHRAGTARTAEQAMAVLAGVLLLPILLLIALVVRATSQGPALVRQPRVGADEQTLPALRFRTTAVVTGTGTRTAVDTHTTRVGAVLRRLSLDELPALLDAARGSRPLLRAARR